MGGGDNTYYYDIPISHGPPLLYIHTVLGIPPGQLGCATVCKICGNQCETRDLMRNEKMKAVNTVLCLSLHTVYTNICNYSIT